jgi:hypothetical protein
MLERADTPWYGNARLFRRTRAGDWSGVIADVAAALRGLVEQRGVGPRSTGVDLLSGDYVASAMAARPHSNASASLAA